MSDVPIEDSFTESFQRFIGERTEVAITDSSEHSQYLKHNEEALRMEDIIIKKMPDPDEARELIIKFTGAVMDASCIHIEASYIQGLRDGIRFRNILLDGQAI